ncbi:hypothetical protein E2C01_021901 [Portunus trituberculatus]|uniref:Uncharacterized protein n=1 Tax=Portunus trituberculatus TaxID=210409 RepID=A0A5B7E3U0_PORTR|nr:hypothetical protein [Portunus trituberculatus]
MRHLSHHKTSIPHPSPPHLDTSTPPPPPPPQHTRLPPISTVIPQSIHNLYFLIIFTRQLRSISKTYDNVESSNT